MMAFEYSGYRCAMSAAPPNDFSSWPRAAALTCSDPGVDAMMDAKAEAYPAVSSAPSIDCMTAPPRSLCRSAVPDAIPARDTGTEPVRECDAGVPAKPTPMPTQTKVSNTGQYGMSSCQNTSATTSPRTQNA